MARLITRRSIFWEVLVCGALVCGQQAWGEPPSSRVLPRTGAEFPPELLTAVTDFTNGFGGAEREV
ncbi:MAG: hypothetical protein EHM42_03955, partial [Planctomycetaceae bacterium]